METPIQKLIKILEKDIQNYAVFNDGEKNVTAILIKQKCEDELLEMERQMIIDAVNYGSTADIALDTQYYEENFNNVDDTSQEFRFKSWCDYKGWKRTPNGDYIRRGEYLPKEEVFIKWQKEEAQQ